MRKIIISFLLSAMMAVSFCSCSPKEPVMPINLNSETAPLERPDPGENYYGYVNFDYLSNGQIPYGKKGFGHLDNINTELENDINDIFNERIIGKTPTDKSEIIVKELYDQYLDIDAREAAGADALLPLIDMVEKSETIDDLIDTMGTIYLNYGVYSFIHFRPNPDLYDSSINRLTLMYINTCGNMKENFTKTDEGSELIGSLVENTLVAFKTDTVEAHKRAVNVVAMIQDIMRNSMDATDMYSFEKHYNLYSKKEFAELFSNIDTEKMLKAFNLESDEIVVYDVGNAEKTNEYLTSEHMRELKDYILACTLNEYYSSLPPSYTEYFLGNSKNNDPEKAAKTFIANKVPEDIGNIYGKVICTEEVMTSANKMLNDLKNSCRDLISKSGRLSEDSKKKLTTKLDNIIFLVGYNKDYVPPYEITPAKDGGTLLENMIAIKRGMTLAEINGLSEKPDRNTWGMSPIEINALYSPLTNTVTIPAVMLSKADYDPADGEFKNLGKLGYTIAHEMNHAFDSNGFLFDENGCYAPENIDEKDRNAYKDVQSKVIDHYSNYRILEIYSINGEQTLGENIADMGAVQCITNITDNKDELKQIFEGVAEGWAALEIASDVIMQLSGDEHSPAEARVNAVVACNDKFYEVYDIKETDKMYVAPENRIKVW